DCTSQCTFLPFTKSLWKFTSRASKPTNRFWYQNTTGNTTGRMQSMLLHEATIEITDDGNRAAVSAFFPPNRMFLNASGGKNV
ncbi:hypothetical protein M5D96_003024, partial [Drosophila gunungcola]